MRLKDGTYNDYYAVSCIFGFPRPKGAKNIPTAISDNGGLLRREEQRYLHSRETEEQSFRPADPILPLVPRVAEIFMTIKRNLD